MSRTRDLLSSIQHQGYLWTLLVLLALAGLLVALMSRDPLDLERPRGGQAVEARITSLSSLGDRYQGRWPGVRVGAQTAEGIRGVTTALPVDLEGCKVGDRIEAEQAGTKLYLNPRPCK